MADNKSTMNAGVGEHGLKKKKIGVPTVVFMIFCLVAAGCYGIEEAIPECGPGHVSYTHLAILPLPLFLTVCSTLPSLPSAGFVASMNVNSSAFNERPVSVLFALTSAFVPPSTSVEPS